MHMITKTITSREQTFDLVFGYLHNDEASWSNGISGAIAEFMYARDEKIEFKEHDNSLHALTERGAIGIDFPADITCFAYEKLTHCTQSWTQTVAIALPETQAALQKNHVITDCGPDKESLSHSGSEQRLFDPGLSSEQIQYCVRTEDTQLIKELHSLCGQKLLATGNDILTLLQQTSPARVVISRLGRIEVIPQYLQKAQMWKWAHIHICCLFCYRGTNRYYRSNMPQPSVFTRLTYCSVNTARRKRLTEHGIILSRTCLRK